MFKTIKHCIVKTDIMALYKVKHLHVSLYCYQNQAQVELQPHLRQ